MFHFFPLESRSSELDGETEPSHPEGRKLTYERDFLLQLQTHPLSQIKPEGLPDLEVVLGQARTLSKSCFSQNRYFSKTRCSISLLKKSAENLILLVRYNGNKFGRFFDTNSFFLGCKNLMVMKICSFLRLCASSQE